MMTSKFVYASAPLSVSDMWSVLFPNKAEQRSDSPVSYISAEHPNLVLVPGGSASAGMDWSPDCTIPPCAAAEGR